MDKDKGKASSTWRTSQQAWLASDATPQIATISARVSAATCTPLGFQEALQVLHYGLSGKYDAHLDAFDPQFYASQQDFLKRIENGHRNRLVRRSRLVPTAASLCLRRQLHFSLRV